MANEQAPRDENSVPSLLLVDDVTGDTIPAACDSDGNLLVIASITDATVPDGGTGRTSFTAYAPIFGGTTSTGALQSGTVGTSGQVLTSNGAGALPTFQTPAASGGTVTSVSVTTANGVSGSVADATTTPAITLTLGAITPTSVNGLTVTTTTGTLTIADGKTLTANNTLTFAGVDGKTLTFNKTMTFDAADDTGAYTFPTGTKTLVATDVATLSSLASVGTITTGVWNATDIPLSAGGTGASLADPNADRILFWDDSAGAMTWLTVGTGLTITDTTISASGGSNKGSAFIWDVLDTNSLSTTVNGTGFVDSSNNYAYLMDTGATSGSHVRRYGQAGAMNDAQALLPASTGWQNDFWIEFSMATFNGATTQEAWGGYCIQSAASTFEPSSGATTVRHACFFFNGTQIIASNANNTTQTATNVSGDPTIPHAYRIEFDYGATTIKYYIDGTLVATHTTNLPTDTGAIAPVFGSLNTAAVERGIKLSRYFQVGNLI